MTHEARDVRIGREGMNRVDAARHEIAKGQPAGAKRKGSRPQIRDLSAKRDHLNAQRREVFGKKTNVVVHALNADVGMTHLGGQ